MPYAGKGNGHSWPTIGTATKQPKHKLRKYGIVLGWVIPGICFAATLFNLYVLIPPNHRIGMLVFSGTVSAFLYWICRKPGDGL